MKHLALHNTTRAQLSNFIASPAHALLLTGPTGIGKSAIATSLIAGVLKLPEPKLASHPYFLRVNPEGPSISIDAVRQLQKFLQLKTLGDIPFRRAVLIEQAHLLTHEAQNAFLKLLEEPPRDTLLVLTATSPRGLLPTILSRTQTITVTPPSQQQLRDLLTQSSKSETERTQAYFLSGGLPGLLSALLNEDEHPLLESVALAKNILSKHAFERLAIVDGLSKQKEAALGFTEALERIARAGLASASSKKNTSQIKQWHSVRKASVDAQVALQKSANAKLVLSNLMLRLG